jgi:CHAT domain-containing protein
MISAMLQPGSKISSQQNLAGDRGMLSKHLRNITDEKKHVINRDSEDLLKQAGAIEKLQRELSLPGVETELNSISNTLKNKTLLNEQFTVSNFNQQITGKSYEIIHIASHGIFSSDVNSSFLMAYDDIIMLDDLKKFLKRDMDAGGNIQLLTLSACQTAEGDDRAPLGFTGVALKAEALSALGSLWPISDNAASQLMAGFYRHLTQHLGKAESLRQAQLELLKNPGMRHPFYWAPFILVGNWL